MKSLFSRMFFFAAATVFSTMLMTPSPTQAQGTREWTDINPKCVSEEGVATIVGTECIVTNLLNIGASLTGITSFVMLLIGSGLFLLSGGDPRKTELGSKTMTFAFIGILVSVSGWIVINFVSTFTGVETIKFFNVTVGEPTPPPQGTL